MPKFISLETETDVKRLSKENYSKVAIKNKPKEEVIDVSVKTITRIFKNVGIRRQAISKKEPIPKFNRPPIKRTHEMISKVKRLVDRKNPASHGHIQKETTLILSTINKIIPQALSKDTRKKMNFSGIRKTAIPIAASYMRSTCQETNPNLRSLWMKRSFMSMKQMDRLAFSMYNAEKPYRMIGYLKKVKVSVRASR